MVPQLDVAGPVLQLPLSSQLVHEIEVGSTLPEQKAHGLTGAVATLHTEPLGSVAVQPV